MDNFLFDFGRSDGAMGTARLQHPLGVAVADGRIYIADSYNAAIRVVDLDRRTVRTLDSIACTDPVCRPQSEPAGVAVDGARLLVSDTNNHRIVAIDLAAGTSRTWFA